MAYGSLGRQVQRQGVAQVAALSKAANNLWQAVYTPTPCKNDNEFATTAHRIAQHIKLIVYIVLLSESKHSVLVL